MIQSFIDTAVGFVWNYPVIILCLCTGLYFTFGPLKLVQFRFLKHAFHLLKGDYDDPNEKGHITHFQALSAALSGTIGLGNIAGVAIAISLGGPGAVLWMWIVGVLGMATKFVECTLGTHFRHESPHDGKTFGGPMYYIEKGLGSKWKFLGIFFAICAVLGSFGAGGMFQANQTASALTTFYGIEAWQTGLVIAGLVSLVIIGGIKRIGHVASRIVPSMCVIYVLGSLLICIMNIDKIPFVIQTIISDAFTGQAAAGGSIGAVILMGVRRAVFSNEAGLGSASIAHAAVKTNYPVREGIVASLGPLIDTIIVCTATACVIIMSGFYGTEKYQRSELISNFENPTVIDKRYVQETSPKESERVRHYKDGDKVLKLTNTDSFIDLPPTPLSTQEKETHLRLSYFKDHGNITVQVLGSDNSILTEIPFDSKAIGLSKSNDQLLSQEGFLLDQKWQSMIFTLSPLLQKTIIKESGSLPPVLRLRLKPTTNAPTQWFLDRYEIVTPRNGINLTIDAYDVFLKGFGTIFITLAVVLFAFSTMITWSYYGEVSARYIFGHKSVLVFKAVFVFLIYVGSVQHLSSVLNFTDLMVGLMVIPNMIAIIPLSKTVLTMTRDYQDNLQGGVFKRFKKSKG